jgi:hypothetical protein
MAEVTEASTPQDQLDAQEAAAFGGPEVNEFEGQYVDYFGVDRTEKVMLPDGKSYIIIKELDEGGRRNFQNKTNKDVRLQRQTGDAFMKLGTGEDRYAMLESAITDWNLHSKHGQTGEMVAIPFNATQLKKFLDSAPTKVIDLIEKKIRLMNPWLQGEISVEDIDKQIEDLQEMREAKLQEEESGNG